MNNAQKTNFKHRVVFQGNRVIDQTHRDRSGSINIVRKAQGMAFARSISENHRASHQHAPLPQDINEQITLAQGKAYRRVNSREASRERW